MNSILSLFLTGALSAPIGNIGSSFSTVIQLPTGGTASLNVANIGGPTANGFSLAQNYAATPANSQYLQSNNALVYNAQTQSNGSTQTQNIDSSYGSAGQQINQATGPVSSSYGSGFNFGSTSTASSSISPNSGVINYGSSQSFAQGSNYNTQILLQSVPVIPAIPNYTPYVAPKY